MEGLDVIVSGGKALSAFPSIHGKIPGIRKRLRMFSTTLWLTALALESVLLLRAFLGNFLKHYRFFYLYLGCVFIRDMSLLPVYYLWPKFYPYAYWYSQFFHVAVGCGVVWEAYKLALSRYPGAARMARNVLSLIFIFSISRILVNVWNNPNWIPGRSFLEPERDLRIVQLTLLIGLVALFAYYAIPLGRNLKGIIYGFSIFIGTSVIQLTLRVYLGDSFEHLWEYLQPMAYLLVLVIWCITLWSYATVPEPEMEPNLEVDYESLVRATRKQLSSARTYLSRTIGTRLCIFFCF